METRGAERVFKGAATLSMCALLSVCAEQDDMHIEITRIDRYIINIRILLKLNICIKV